MALVSVLGSAALAKPARYTRRSPDEVHFSNEEFKKLDRFEAHALEKADEAYRQKRYPQAAEYESFLREFPRSLATPYVLLRKGRCLHNDEKRNVAIRQYNEVLDYFPNVVPYAAAALYYQGQAHWENGDEDKAMKQWAQMARDKEYRKHPLAAGAINRLADNLAAKENADSAVSYFRQVAVDFRTANPHAADYARDQVIRHHVRTSPNEPKLRKFYAEARVLKGHKTEEDLAKSFEYWDDLRDKIVQHGRFTDKETELGARYYAYWAKQLDGRFAGEDDYQMAVAGFHRAAGGDVTSWIKRLDDQFARGRKDDYGRIVKWIAAFHAHKPKVMQYYNMLDFSKMTHGQITALIHALYDEVGDARMARNAFFKLDLAKMPDDQKARLARYLWEKDSQLGIDLCMSMSSKDRGRHELLLYYHSRNDLKNGLPLADHLIGVPEYASDALWKKAELLERNAKYAEAILAYRRITEAPANLWRIASCYEKMGKVDQAVGQLREIEAFFKKHSAQAAVRVAYVYQRAKLRDRCIAAFRQVLTKYPDTRESSDAHHQLERMGVARIKGGLRDRKETE
jgi:tetratricopeptide (TPR) repeat protein